MAIEVHGLQDLVDDGVFVSVEAQFHLSQVVGKHDWNMDLGEGTFTLTGDHPMQFHPELLGSTAPGPGTWLWAWANSSMSEFPAVLVAAEATRAFGQAHGVDELTSGEVPLSSHRELGQCLTIAAKAVTSQWFHYSCPIGGGSRAQVLLLGDELPQLPPPSAVTLPRIINQGLSEVDVSDHRRAITMWAWRREVPLAWLDGFTCALTLPEGTMEISFDEQLRISRIGGEVSA